MDSFTPRRSPRGHRSSCVRPRVTSTPSNKERRLFANAHLVTPSPIQKRCSSTKSSLTDSFRELDRRALSTGEITSDEEGAFSPPRPAPLRLGQGCASPNSLNFEEEIMPQPPETNNGTPQPLPVFSDAAQSLMGSTGSPQAPFAYTGPTQSPPVYTGSTQSSPAYTGTTQPPSTGGTTQPPQSYAAIIQPSSTYAGTTQPPAKYTGTTQPPAACIGTTQPPATYTGTTQQLPTYTGPTQSPTPTPNRQCSPRRGDVRMNRTASVENTQNRVLAGQERDNGIREAIGTADDDETKKDLQRLFVHVNRVTVHQQKALASAFNVTQLGNKIVRAARLFVVISGIMERTKKTALQVLGEKATEKGKDFRTEYDRTVQFWSSTNEDTVVPAIADLEALSGVRQHPRERRTRDVPIDDMSDSEIEGEQGNQSRGNGVTLEEFARLMIIFRDHPEVANDLRRSGQDLTRKQLDINVTRNAFWTDRVEVIFNDRSVSTNERLDGPLNHVDPVRPVATFRSGSSLQDLFARFRKEFTEKFKNWDVSGNMDPGTFVNFCRLPGQTTLTRPGARCLIAWKIFKFGTSQQNDFLLDFCSKEMAGAASAQLESGICTNGESGVTSRRRKRTLVENSTTNANLALADALRAFSKSNERASCSQQKGPAQKKTRAEIEELDVVQARAESQRKLVSNFIEAKKMLEDNSSSGDSRFDNILKNYYLSLAEQIEKGGS